MAAGPEGVHSSQKSAEPEKASDGLALGFGFWAWGFRVEGFGFWVWGFGVWGFRAEGLGFRASGSGFSVQGLGRKPTLP